MGHRDYGVYDTSGNRFRVEEYSTKRLLPGHAETKQDSGSHPRHVHLALQRFSAGTQSLTFERDHLIKATLVLVN